LFFQLHNLQQGYILQRILFIAVITALFLFQTYLRFRSDAFPDVAWFIYVANQLLHGKTLYVDMMEVNPPLGVWLVVPSVWIAEKLQIDEANAVYATVIAMSAVTVWSCSRILHSFDVISIQARRLITVAVAVAILFFPGAFFAEREHYMPLLFLPWLFLRIVPNASMRQASAERIFIGLLAGAAVCIKPHSVLAPILVELTLYLRRRDLRSFVAVENLGAALFVIFYGLTIWMFTPKFMTEMIQLGSKAYVPFYGNGIFETLVGIILTVPAFVMAMVIRYRLALLKADTQFVDGMLAAVLGFILSYFVQMKGFGYQILPADILASIASVSAAVILWQFEKKVSATVIFAVCLSTLLLVLLPQNIPRSFETWDEIIDRNAPQAKSLFIASTDISDGFPYVQRRNLIWASSLPAQWLTPYVDSKWKDGPVPQDAIVQRALDLAVTDLITFKPDIVMIDTADQIYLKSGKFEYIKFWQNDKRFSAIWNNYKFRETVSGMEVYTLQTP
jgi:hypothetical protein